VSDELGSKDERSVLASEWLSRQYRRASIVRARRLAHGAFDRNGRFDDQGVRLPFDPVTTYDLYPPAIAPGLRFAAIQPSMLEYLVAMTRVISSETSYALYLTDNVQAFADARLARVEEYAEVPAMRVQTSEVPTRVKKYGRRIDMSYEQMRRMSMDMISFYIEYIAAVASREKEDQAIDVLVNGDGNASTSATNTNGSTLDAAAAGAADSADVAPVAYAAVHPSVYGNCCYRSPCGHREEFCSCRLAARIRRRARSPTGCRTPTITLFRVRRWTAWS
jgi:hypothetical protein